MPNEATFPFRIGHEYGRFSRATCGPDRLPRQPPAQTLLVQGFTAWWLGARFFSGVVVVVDDASPEFAFRRAELGAVDTFRPLA